MRIEAGVDRTQCDERANEQGRAVLYMTGKTLVKRLDFGVGQGDWKSTEWVGNDVGVTFALRLTGH